MLRIPYKGSKVLTLALTLDKPMTKRILFYHGLPTPEFQVFEEPDEPLDRDLIGDDGGCVSCCSSNPAAKARAWRQRREHRHVGRAAPSPGGEAALIVQPTDSLRALHRGREVTVGIIGNLEPTAARRVKERTLIEEVPTA